jgi:GT2 family glycosyltransferase
MNMSLPSVVIPIYNAFGHLQSCLDSIVATVPVGTQVVLIDDASTDKRIQPLMRSFAARPGPAWKLHFQDQNRGFVSTVNHGMSMLNGNIVLLNSDTEVTPGWLQGLSRCLASDTGIATATPWTNNGEIASIPRLCVDHAAPANPASVAEVIARSGTPIYPDIPTAVGFCMAISRAAIDAVGQFDADTFGRGYGEENDFSMRVAEAGWRNVLCDDVYVVHHGGASFGPLGLKPDESALQKLLALHPDYLERVQAFIDTDPLAARRGELIHALKQAGIELDGKETN